MTSDSPLVYVQPLSEQLNGRLGTVDLHRGHVEVVHKHHTPVRRGGRERREGRGGREGGKGRRGKGREGKGKRGEGREGWREEGEEMG